MTLAHLTDAQVDALAAAVPKIARVAALAFQRNRARRALAALIVEGRQLAGQSVEGWSQARLNRHGKALEDLMARYKAAKAERDEADQALRQLATESAA